MEAGAGDMKRLIETAEMKFSQSSQSLQQRSLRRHSEKDDPRNSPASILMSLSLSHSVSTTYSYRRDTSLLLFLKHIISLAISMRHGLNNENVSVGSWRLENLSESEWLAYEIEAQPPTQFKNQPTSCSNNCMTF